MSFFDVPSSPKMGSLEAIKRVNGGSQSPEGRSIENWKVFKWSEDKWVVCCCGDIMYGPTTEEAAKAFYRSMTSR